MVVPLFILLLKQDKAQFLKHRLQIFHRHLWLILLWLVQPWRLSMASVGTRWSFFVPQIVGREWIVST